MNFRDLYYSLHRPRELCGSGRYLPEIKETERVIFFFFTFGVYFMWFLFRTLSFQVILLKETWLWLPAYSLTIMNQKSGVQLCKCYYFRIEKISLKPPSGSLYRWVRQPNHHKTVLWPLALKLCTQCWGTKSSFSSAFIYSIWITLLRGYFKYMIWLMYYFVVNSSCFICSCFISLTWLVVT